jgi:hypothetical protein
MHTTTASASGALERANTQTHGWIKKIGRIGISARGVIYLILAYLAFDIARHGNAPTQATSTGALEELGHRSGGPALLLLLAVGLGAYAIWRLFDAATNKDGAIKRLASLAIAVIYFGLLAKSIELAMGHKANGGASSNPQPLVAKVLGWPAGRVIVGVGGTALLIGGVVLGLWGLFHRYSKTLAWEHVGRRWRKAIRTLGAVGDLARGFLIALVGAYLIGTAVTGNASQAKGIDQALKSLLMHSYGAILIGAVALGLLSFGIFSFCEARLRRL